MQVAAGTDIFKKIGLAKPMASPTASTY